MRTLITGIHGFVGRHLAPALLNRGDEVLGLDQADGPSAGFEFSHLDLADAEGLARQVANFQPDNVLHLAAQSAPGCSIREPGPTIRTNVEGTLHLLEALRQGAPKSRLLFISSSEVYGDQGNGPLEERTPREPVNPYGVSKAAGELLVAQYGRSWGLDTVIARSFPHTGPGQAPAFALPSFARQVARIEAGLQEPRLCVGNLEARRDILDVEDVVAAYLLLLERGSSGEAYNVCSGEAHSIGEGLQVFLDLSDAEIAVETDPELLRPLDQPVLYGRPDKLKAATGWMPKRPYRETLERVLADWRGRVRREEQ
jgi:GDP-4-dehydro-6-deoxy-D-mannose reductase